MFRKLIFTLAIIFSFSFSALATESVEYDIAPSVQTEVIKIENNKNKKKEVKEKLKEKNSKKSKLKKAKEFKSVMNCNSRAVKNNVEDYVRFVYENDFSNEQLEIINRILNSGVTVQTLTEVYEFWLTTDEDFTMVEEICALEDKYFSPYWYENAFNSLTNCAHGALNRHQIRKYQDLGITNDQILAANVMCRKKEQNIHTILDSVLLGVSIEQQAYSIYGTELNVLEGTLFSAVTDIAKASKEKTATLSIDTNLIKDDIFYEALRDIVSEELSELSISVSESSLLEDSNALRNSNYPIGVQIALMNKGFTPQEIEKSSKLNESSVFTAAKKAREILKNEK